MYIVEPKNKSLLIVFFLELKDILNIIDFNFCSIRFSGFKNVFLVYRREIRVIRVQSRYAILG